MSDAAAKYVVAVTNNRWYSYLRDRQLDELNFWSPGTATVNLPAGTPWLFKLHSPDDYVVGGGYFVHRTTLPLRMVWETFGDENGASTYDEFRRQIGKDDPGEIVGCTVLSDCFYWPRDLWLPPPPEWKKNIVSYKTYTMSDVAAAAYWDSVAKRLPRYASLTDDRSSKKQAGKPVLHIPRLGQGGFRTGIIDAYDRRCAITGERTLPALEAAHIIPFAQVQHHDLRNGLLLRADLHKLFDDGYVTVDSAYRFHVSRRIKEEFENGRDYYAMHGRAMRLPADSSITPDSRYLEEHASKIFRE